MCTMPLWIDTDGLEWRIENDRLSLFAQRGSGKSGVFQLLRGVVGKKQGAES